jgi:Ca2+-binding EF-hand superfamily protein
MSAEDYLDKVNMKTTLNDAVNLLLENRPENPLLFLYEHFKNASSSGSNKNETNILKAYRLIQMNKHISSESFDDNTFEAFTLLERGEDNCGVLGIDFIKIV